MAVSAHYIYLLQEREFIKTNENIYKIGKTKQEHLKRFKQYPKGSRLLLQIICSNCDALELQLIKKFKQKFIHRGDIGAEYFEGDCVQMLQIIYNKIIEQTQPNNQHNQQPNQHNQQPNQHNQPNIEHVIKTYAGWLKHSTIKTIIPAITPDKNITPDKKRLIEGQIIFNSGTTRKFYDSAAQHYNSSMETLQDFIKANQQKNIKYNNLDIYNDIVSNLYKS